MYQHYLVRDPLMANVPLLPPEIHIMILSHLVDSLESSHDDSMKRWLLTLTLRSCNLVCQLWHLVCRKCLMKDIRIGSRGQLDDMVEVLEGTKDFNIFGLTKRLTLEMAPKKLGICFERSFDEATIRSLSSGFPHLQVLRMRGHAAKGDPASFPISSSLTGNYRQFLQLRDLSLERYRFQTFWDLDDLVASIPSLSSLKFDQVTWPPLPPRTSRLPSPHSSPSLLQHLRIKFDPHVAVVEDPHSRPINQALSVLWFWATTVSGTSFPLPSPGDYRDSDLPINPVPRFTREDVLVIQQVLRMFFGTFTRTGYFELSWVFFPRRNICHFCCRDGSGLGSAEINFEIGKRLFPTPKPPEPPHITPIANVRAFTITERTVPIHSMRSLDWYQRLAAIAGGFQDLRGIYSRIRTFPSLHASHPLAHEWWDQERKRALRTIRQTLQSLRYDLSPVEVSFFLVFDDNASGEETGILDVDIMSEELDEDSGDEDPPNNDTESSPPQHSDNSSDASSTEDTEPNQWSHWHLPVRRSQFEDAIWSYLNSGETSLEGSSLLSMIQPNLYECSVVRTEISQVDSDISLTDFGDVFDLEGTTQDTP
ncbi:hypothetical protein NLI96_g3288 [Meripilus lineatus]|uniref:F-box domain-containing protein n=1 Tax=Meripilus lineatus TaxID=2056292 RepID=A0AAD5V703_9APHY|nr:hypothetical protein NLI96_g3288 [Physisporinus lineatus]